MTRTGHNRARRSLIALAAGLGLAGAGATALAAQPAAVTAAGTDDAMPYAVEDFPDTLQVMSWNMCGPRRATYNCDLAVTPEMKVKVVTDQVARNRVEAVLLQEVCEDDLALLMTRLGPGWSKSFEQYEWAQFVGGERRTWKSRCGEDDGGRADRVGTAIVARGALTDARKYPVVQPEQGQQTPFQCATATLRDVRLCSVHATRVGANPHDPTQDLRDEQYAQIRDVVRTFPRVVFGGDFNSRPPEDPTGGKAAWPAGLYSTGPGTPGYRECDQSGTARVGRPTYNPTPAKLDYLFSSESPRWCTVTETPASDHRFLVESVGLGR
ncbi:endonuclease/exonuclease/phosphatase family protein [Streptomyces sp. NPDC048606]|uniref:endonuclease/exonuclease/phosphatase family protein n=1 Tax=Streptomyces sp. NPDC048606 TaxID=3154726 RepID=UPI0034436B19